MERRHCHDREIEFRYCLPVVAMMVDVPPMVNTYKVNVHVHVNYQNIKTIYICRSTETRRVPRWKQRSGKLNR